MISVIVVNYNGMRFIRGCLTSLAKQTAEDFEVIVVDDGSTDNGAEIVKGFEDSRLINLAG